jgi:anti-sigma-K factor RskA
MMTHEDASELLASYALDAVVGDEHEQIEAHLEECPRCRAELDAYRDVTAAMGNSVEPLPEGLWSSISSRLPERMDEEPPPMPRLVFTHGVEAAREERVRPRGSRNVLAVIGTIAVGAAAVASVLGINLVRADNRVASYQNAIGQSTPTAVVAALETPGHKVVNLTNTSGHRLAQFVITPDWRGYLVTSNLRPLSSGETYQLWGINDGRSISLGLLGQSPNQATFTSAGSSGPSQLGITVEPAGGSVVPSSPMVASGTV